MLWIVIGVTLALLAGLIYLPMARLPGKTLAVAQAAYRETVRQPLFWFLLIFSAFFMVLLVFLQYFTFGEDLKMIKQIGNDLIMLMAGLFGVLVASMSISEEIEGRTEVSAHRQAAWSRQSARGSWWPGWQGYNLTFSMI